MGEVYRARDMKLKRDVAIKVLPDTFANDPEWMARFQREAEVLASLNHPNIAHIYGVEERALVMELAEGDSPKGPLPLQDARRIALQIAEALEYAHEKGIIHRDLKPANIKVAHEGTVKILDFGLAKALDEEPDFASAQDSPTLTLGATRAGAILGTAAYMAPEQAIGKPADRRSDVWSFGTVLYELLTGAAAFTGESAPEVLAAVVKVEPDWDKLPAETSAPIRTLLQRCLTKDRKKRLQAIGEARIVLEKPAVEEPAVSAPPRPQFGIGGWISAGILGLTAAGLALVHFRVAPATQRVLRLSIPLPENSAVGNLELSPDGRRLALLMLPEGSTGDFQIFVRSLDSGELHLLPGTARARNLFWSPDSRFLGFFADGKLQVIPAAGGPARTLCGETGVGGGGAWNRQGVILFASQDGRLRRVNANGGECGVVSKDDPKIRSAYPVFLADGNHYLYIRRSASVRASSDVYVATQNEPAGHMVLAGPDRVIYTPNASAGTRAHLLFLRESTLMAQPFDDISLQVVGEPFAVASRASRSLLTSLAASAAPDGTLIYLAGFSRLAQLTWYDRSGKELGKVGPPSVYVGVSLSPDGSMVATRRRDDSGSQDIWLYDLARGGSERRLAPSDPSAGSVVWSPDSRFVLFTLNGPERSGLYQIDLKGGPQQASEMISAAGPREALSDWSHDGHFLLYTDSTNPSNTDIWYRPVESGKPGAKARLVATDASESQGQLSPDGKWLAYVSDNGSRDEVYVRKFPTGAEPWKVSTGEAGGLEPRWSSDGKQLYFTDETGVRATLLAANIESDGHGGLRIGSPQRLFQFRVSRYGPLANEFSYSPYPDGQRFLVNALVESSEPTVNVITNWQKAVGR
jgi:Tol biopolymer transport system component